MVKDVLIERRHICSLNSLESLFQDGARPPMNQEREREREREVILR